MTATITGQIAAVRKRIEEAAARAGRSAASIRLLAVSKTVPPERIRQAILAGQTLFGENYVQEAREKIPAIGRDVEWHMIGHLQTNKAKYVVQLFDWIHSVDRLDLARELDRRAGQHNRKLNILLEVNISGEESKSGVEASGTIDLVRQIALLPNLRIRGLMTMPPFTDDCEASRPYFAALRNLRDVIASAAIDGVSMTELSMGTTDDFDVAVEEGATIVRVGRAIFGERAHR